MIFPLDNCIKSTRVLNNFILLTYFLFHYTFWNSAAPIPLYPLNPSKLLIIAVYIVVFFQFKISKVRNNFFVMLLFIKTCVREPGASLFSSTSFPKWGNQTFSKTNTQIASFIPSISWKITPELWNYLLYSLFVSNTSIQNKITCFNFVIIRQTLNKRC